MLKKLLLVFALCAMTFSLAQTLEESFDEVFPKTGWVNNNCSLGLVPRSGKYSLKFDAAGDYIETPIIAAPGKLSFFYLSESYDTTTWSATVEIVDASNTVLKSYAITDAKYEYSNEFSQDISAYNNVKVRIRDTRSSGNNARFVDDITIIGRNQPNINIYSFNHTIYHNNSNFMSEDGTDMFRRITYATDASGYWDYVYTVRNIGSQPLNLGKMTMTGVDAKNFSFLSDISNTSIAAGAESSFAVRYDPRYAGIHMVSVNIPSNDPDQPVYIINLKGYAVDCDLPQQVIAENNFENNATSSMPYTQLNTIGAKSLNAVTLNSRTTSGTTYFPNYSAMAAGGIGRSWWINNSTQGIELGPINVTGKKGLAVTLESAGFSRSGTTGLDPDDRIEVYVSLDNGVTWSKEAYIEGANRSKSQVNYQYVFSTDPTRTFMMNYDGNNSFIRWGNDKVAKDAIGYFILDIPDEVNATSIKLRIIAKTDAQTINPTTGANLGTDSGETLVIDNIKIVSRGVPKTKKWKGNGVWSDELGVLSTKPLYTQKVIFEESYDSAVYGDVEACKCDIAAGKTVSIKANNYMKIESDIQNDGTLTVESDGNLIQVSKKGTYTGANPVVTVKRNANLKLKDYNYWGTPVSTANKLMAFSPNTSSTSFYTYNEANDFFVRVSSPSTTDFVIGKGYAIRAPMNFPGDFSTPANNVFKGEFLGKPNNGDILVPLAFTDAAHGFNLLSNPYPSNIDFEMLYQANADLIYNTMYLWTNTNDNPKMQGSNYPQNLQNGKKITNNYAVYNGTGGVGAPFGFDPLKPASAAPNRYVKVGQGFIVKAKKAGDLLFENEMRNANNTAVFFNKMSGNKASKKSEEEFDRYWLQLKTPLDYVSPLLIGHVPDATNDFEMDYDAEHLVIAGDSFYSILQDKKLVIQGREMFQQKDTIPLGAMIGISGEHIIALGNKEGIFANGQPIYLKDKLTNQWVNLQEKNYTFSAEQGALDNRFEILYSTDALLSSTDIAHAGKIKCYQNGNGFTVEAPETIKEVSVYDIAGKLIKTYHGTHNKLDILMNFEPRGIFLVKMKTKNAEQTIKIAK